MSKALFDLPPTHACRPVKVEVPQDFPLRVHMSPTDRQIIADVKAWERRDRTPQGQPQGPLPGVPAIRAAIHGNLQALAPHRRVLTAADVRPFSDQERVLLGQAKAFDQKMSLNEDAVERGIRAGTEKALSDGGPLWENYGDWLDKKKGEGKL
jgi:hypothetical protein